MTKQSMNRWALQAARRFRRYCRYWAIPCGLFLMLQVAVAQAVEPGLEYDAEESGFIERIDLANGTAIIGGLRYRSAPGLKVEINNSFGAFSMLQTGMYVRIYYREPVPSVRQLVFVEQVMNSNQREET